MKEVISSTPSETITLSEALKKEYPIIGFQKNAIKIHLIASSYKSDSYFARSMIGWEKGNGYNPDGKDTKTINEWSDFFFTYHKARMFVFDSPQELFKWLSETE
jgi:hypothetical protein